MGRLFYAYAINIFWALWWLIVYVSALLISPPLSVSRKEIVRVAQSCEGLI
ncbi:MAG: hypothetical protein RMI45_00520 [Ignisphaera sp.]|nr:hypothetical protein [Ignisphaera sp.]MDW8084709.1 hypothetical protein [Ignisphaera sp.]